MRADPRITGYVVRKATEYIKEYGWKQRAFGSIHSGFCMLGAMREACLRDLVVEGEVARIRAYSAMSDDIGEWLVNLSGGVPFIHSSVLAAHATHFNDDPSRTEEEVLLHMNKFADEIDPQVAGD